MSSAEPEREQEIADEGAMNLLPVTSPPIPSVGADIGTDILLSSDSLYTPTQYPSLPDITSRMSTPRDELGKHKSLFLAELFTTRCFQRVMSADLGYGSRSKRKNRKAVQKLGM